MIIYIVYIVRFLVNLISQKNFDNVYLDLSRNMFSYWSPILNSFDIVSNLFCIIQANCLAYLKKQLMNLYFPSHVIVNTLGGFLIKCKINFVEERSDLYIMLRIDKHYL